MAVKRKLKIAILMGGPSAEHDVSLNTGRQILENLDSRKYIVESVTITKAGKWFISEATPQKIAEKENQFMASEERAIKEVARRRTDIVFIALHGKYGEDGTVQGLLETVGIPYTGSGVLASALGMNKPRSLSIFRDAGLTVPEFRVVENQEIKRKSGAKFIREVMREFSLPLVIKPADHGSSIGVSIVQDAHDFMPALHEAFRHSTEAIVQRFIEGKEVTCGVIEEKGKLRALTPIEIVPRRGSFYDYASKYEDGGSDHFIPPRGVPQKILARIRDTACRAHRALNCTGMSRTDCILARDGTPYILEINTIPGMTTTSLLPQAARHDGLDFSQLLDIIIDSALTQRKGKK